MKKFILSSVIFLALTVTSLAANPPAIEMNQGDYTVDNICQGKSGTTVQKSFYDAAGKVIKIKADCLDGQFNGLVKKYNENGKIRLKAHYAKGQLNGRVQLHDGNGNLIYYFDYTNGSPGPRMHYDNKGQAIQVN
ncbi:MAG: hypothetical protein HQL16_06030 [Candidatus Omnitrophica bacterium]|nr:hypothetical protein [Candidatus Omnitrophota bacterium]